MNKVKIFIDAEYVLQSLRVLRGKPMDIKISKFDFSWLNFVKHISGSSQIESVYYYTARLDNVENQKTYDEQTIYLDRITEELLDYGINIRLGKMIKIKNKTKKTWNETRNAYGKDDNEYSWGQKGIDTKIVLDLIKSLFTEYDSAIIVTGDEDFAEAINYIREKKKTIKLVAFDRYDSRLSDELKKPANICLQLSYSDLKEAEII